MKTTLSVLTAVSLLVLADASFAADHLFTTTGAGGLTTSNANPGNGTLRTPPPVTRGMTVPMGRH